MYAIEWNRADIVRQLVGAAADRLRKDTNGLTVNDYAEGSNDKTIKEAVTVTTDASGSDANALAGAPAKSPVEDAAWKALNALELESIRAYLQASPSTTSNRTRALRYYLMQLRMADVRRNAYPREEVIANDALGNAYAKDTDKEVSAGGLWLSPNVTGVGPLALLGGGATKRTTVMGNTNLGLDDSIKEGGLNSTDLTGPGWKQMADSGQPLKFSIWPHTGDGSVMGFDTGGHNVLMYDWILRSSDGPLVFGIVKSVGIVHLAGAGSLKLSTGKVIDFK
jgi:hypothetical protein